MRRLLWLTLGFGAACALCACWIPGNLLLPLMAGSMVLALCIGVLGKTYLSVRAIAVTVLGCALGFGWYLGYYGLFLNAVAAMDGQEAVVSIRTTDFSYETNYGLGVDGTISLNGKDYQVCTYLSPADPIEPGTLLEGNFRFRVTTPDGENDSTYHPGKGIFLLAYQKGDILQFKSEESSLRIRASVLRRKVENILECCFPEDTAAFAKALLLGNTTGLTYETDTALKISGIRHVVAVSGLHVSILFALLTAVTFKRRYLMAFLGFPVLFLFAAVAGFTPSVTRACIMSGLMLLAMLANRDYDRLTALAFAALVMLVLNPLVITSVSFQLSVASVAGICLFAAPINKWILSLAELPQDKKLRSWAMGWISTSVSVTVSATILTTPLCALYFGAVSLVSVLTNLLTLWVISSIFYGIMAVCLVSLFWQSGAALLAAVVSWLIRYVLGVSGLLAAFPLAAVYTKSVYICLWLCFVYLLLILFLLGREKRPVTLLCCGVLGLCLSLLLSWLEPMKDDVRMTVLDVGQGQCILLQSQGKTYMVDCGGDTDTRTADLAAETLLAMGITRLDGVILTHYDDDHAGGAENLLTRLETDVLILPPEYSDRSLSGKQTIFADRELALRWENSVLRVFPADYPGTGNEKSLCILFDTEKCDILITGDRTCFGERMLLRYHDIPDVDVLIAGHHGAESSTCVELLEAVHPETVCISAGENNPYGHPQEALLQRLREFGCSVYRTDRHGTILIRR